jgi:hypothetical protein
VWRIPLNARVEPSTLDASFGGTTVIPLFGHNGLQFSFRVFPPCHGVSRYSHFSALEICHFYWDFGKWVIAPKPAWMLAFSLFLWQNMKLSGAVSR